MIASTAASKNISGAQSPSLLSFILTPFNYSFRHIASRRWVAGSSIYERLQIASPADAVAAWAQDDITYTLRETRGREIHSMPHVKPLDEV